MRGCQGRGKVGHLKNATSPRIAWPKEEDLLPLAVMSWGMVGIHKASMKSMHRAGTVA